MLQITIWLAGCDVSEKNELLLQSTSNSGNKPVFLLRMSETRLWKSA